MRTLRFTLLIAALALVAPACGGDTGGDTGSGGGDAGSGAGDVAGDDAGMSMSDAGATDDDGSGQTDDPDAQPEPEVVVCTPSCGTATCGPDGCGGSCGSCATDEDCLGGACVEDTTPPAGKLCIEMLDCAMTACADQTDDLTSCLEAAEASCGPGLVPEESAAVAAVITCLVDNGCSLALSGSQAECQKSHCLAETVTCYAATYGDMECHEINACIDADDCPKNFVTGEPLAQCLRQCMEGATQADVQEWLNFDLCTVSECFGAENYEECELFVQNTPKCSEDWLDCYGSANN